MLLTELCILLSSIRWQLCCDFNPSRTMKPLCRRPHCHYLSKSHRYGVQVTFRETTQNTSLAHRLHREIPPFGFGNARVISLSRFLSHRLLLPPPFPSLSLSYWLHQTISLTLFGSRTQDACVRLILRHCIGVSVLRTVARMQPEHEWYVRNRFEWNEACIWLCL